MPGMAPSGFCARETLFIHSVSTPSASRFMSIWTADTAASAVQPCFSRWGQSVGMFITLERVASLMIRCSSFSTGSEEVKVPRSSITVLISSKVSRSSVASSPETPVIRTYRAPS